MSRKKTGLGKGLGALLGDTPSASQRASSEVREIALAEVEVNPFQPRKTFDRDALDGLAASIKVHGIIQPVTVRRLSERQYQLIAGERRYQASKQAGLTHIPAYIRTADDQQLLEMALVENIQRENLDPIEVALSYQRLITEVNLKQEELGDRVGKKRATVSNYLRLLKLPPAIQAALRDRLISMGHARALINAGEVATQLDIFKKIMAKGLSVRQAEALTRSPASPSNKALRNASAVHAQEGELRQLQARLATHFGTRVRITGQHDRGEIRLPFLSTEDLNRILQLLIP